jgi:tRNA pseudouridine55 synthase
MHAAIKVGGQKLYDLARRGEEIPRSPRPVTFSCLEILEWNSPVATLLVDCTKGTYIRALARDLGRLTSSAAHLTALRRTRIGPFDVQDAATLDSLANSPAKPKVLRVVADA